MHVIAGGKQARQFDKWRYRIKIRVAQEVAVRLALETQGTLPQTIANAQQIVEFRQSPRRSFLSARGTAFGPPHECTTPTIRRGVAQCTEDGPAGAGVMRACTEAEGGLQGESLIIVQPGGLVLERGAFAALTNACP